MGRSEVEPDECVAVKRALEKLEKGGVDMGEISTKDLENHLNPDDFKLLYLNLRRHLGKTAPDDFVKLNNLRCTPPTKFVRCTPPQIKNNLRR